MHTYADLKEVGRWEGQGLALIADQHGFSKQLVDYHTRVPVWDYGQEDAYERWNFIIKDALPITEAALIQGGGLGGCDKAKGMPECEGSSNDDEVVNGGASETCPAAESSPPAALAPAILARLPLDSAQVGTPRVGTPQVHTLTPPAADAQLHCASFGEAEAGLMQEVVSGALHHPAATHEAETWTLPAVRLQGGGEDEPQPQYDAVAGAAVGGSSAQVAGAHFGADAGGELEAAVPAQDSGALGLKGVSAAGNGMKGVSGAGNGMPHNVRADARNVRADDARGGDAVTHDARAHDATHVPQPDLVLRALGTELLGSALQRAEEGVTDDDGNDDDAFLAALGAQGSGASADADGPPARPHSGNSLGSITSNRSASMHSTSLHSARAGAQLPELYLLEARLVELVSDKDLKPIRLDDHTTYETLWTHEAQSASQLQDMVGKALKISRHLFDNKVVKRNMIQSQGVRYLLEGTMRDFDHPNGNPLLLLDAETEAVVWHHLQTNAHTSFDSLTYHASSLGVHHTALRVVLNLRGTRMEVIEDDKGQGYSAVLEQESRREIWSAASPDAQSTYHKIIEEAEMVGHVLVKWVLENAKGAPPAHTTMDLIKWQCHCREKDKLVFTWTGPSDKKSTPLYGTSLNPKSGNQHMPLTIVFKTASQEMRYLPPLPVYALHPCVCSSMCV